MKRGARLLWAFASLFVSFLPALPSAALEEPDRLWLVGERAAADGLHALARRTLEKLVEGYPQDSRLSQAFLLLGQTRLALGDAEGALQALRRAQEFDPKPGRPMEAKFWEAEALVRLRRYGDANVAYDEVYRNDAKAPFAADALYGIGWTELELKRPDIAAKAFREFLAVWPEHALSGPATYHLGRALAADNRFEEAAGVLQSFITKYPNDAHVPDAQYLRGWARIQGGDLRGGVAELKAFVSANPSHPEAAAARRLVTDTVVRHGGDPQDLLDAYKVLMAQTPPTPEGLFDAAGIAGRLAKGREQDVAWRKLRKEFPDHPLSRRVALELASAAYKRRDWKEAVTQAQAATQAEDEPVRIEAWLLLGEGELKLKRYASAEKAFEGALGVTGLEDPLRYRALAGIGLAREEQRDWRGAMTAYDQVTASSPDQALKDWAQERFNAVKARLDGPRTPEPRTPDKRPPERKREGS